MTAAATAVKVSGTHEGRRDGVGPVTGDVLSVW
jgi:hypothetical protein